MASTDDQVVGDDGLTREQRSLLNATLAAIARVIYADGTVSDRERTFAIRVAREIVDNRFSDDDLMERLEYFRTQKARIRDVGDERFRVIFNVAVGAAMVDGVLDRRETESLLQLAERLGVGRRYAESVIEEATTQTGTHASRDADPTFTRSCEVLGLHPSHTLAEAKARYRELMRRYHPDRAGGDMGLRSEYTLRASRINVAYEYVMQVHARR